MSAVILAVAGEASGDALLAPVVADLFGRGHRVVGIGGPKSVAAGLIPLAPYEGLAAHGLLEAAHTVPAVLRAAWRLRAALPRIDAALLVDFPELNSRLLRWCTAPVAWLAPPQAWAWRAHRAEHLRRAAWVGCLFEFSARWYRERGVAAEMVGHPLAYQAALPPADRADVALLPGSRAGTVARLLPIFLEGARRFSRALPETTFHLGCAPGLPAPPPVTGLKLQIHAGATSALAAASTCWAGAGTATLHAALAGRPVLTGARLHPLTEGLARRLVQVPSVGLPNLVLDRRAFPELVFDACNPEALSRVGQRLTHRRGSLAPALAEVRRHCMPDGFAGRVADRVERLIAR
jgi:lipid-A-disaccharide synthase